ncbi:MAG: peptide chain release factor N(5)-glutamine methyltransferase [Candidatus Aminicenantales bacterium]
MEGWSLSTFQQLFRKGRSLLSAVPAPSVEAKVLLLEAARIGEVEWLASPNRRVSKREEIRYLRLIERRLSGIPLAYITGKKEFWSLSLRIMPGVLIPRPETELTVEKTLELAGRRNPTIVDIGTGCGNIALALAKELPRARIFATDVSARALRNAELNARDHGLGNVNFVRGSLFSALRGLGLEAKCDFVVSNPPYVSAADWETLPAEVKNHEPRRALVGGETGLEFIRRLVKGSPAFLRPGGCLLFEVGEGQAGQAIALLTQTRSVSARCNCEQHSDEAIPLSCREIASVAPLPRNDSLSKSSVSIRYFRDVESFKDLRGITRVIQARRV